MKKIIVMLLFIAADKIALAQNVGIGVNTPAYKLDVGARMRIRTGTIGNNSTSSGIWMEDYRDGTNRAFIGMQDSIRIGFYGAGAGGTGWGFNFNTTNGNVAMANGLLGLGTNAPTYSIHVAKDNPSIGLFDDNDNHLAGLIAGDSINLFINAYRKPSLGSNEAGNIILQSNTTRAPFLNAGNVGIGLDNPEVKLHLSGGTDVSGASGGYLQIGNSNGINIGFDNNEVQARNNGVAAKLSIQASGGDFQTGSGNGLYTITAAGELNRNAVTGTANMVPVCYGKVSAQGDILSGTGNYSATKTSTGVYSISISGETTMSANPHNYIIIVSATYVPNYLGDQFVFIASEIPTTGNAFIVRTREFKVDYTNTTVASECNLLSCEPESVSLIINQPSPRVTDASFSFVVYKL